MHSSARSIISRSPYWRKMWIMNHMHSTACPGMTMRPCGVGRTSPSSVRYSRTSPLSARRKEFITRRACSSPAASMSGRCEMRPSSSNPNEKTIEMACALAPGGMGYGSVAYDPGAASRFWTES